MLLAIPKDPTLDVLMRGFVTDGLAAEQEVCLTIDPGRSTGCLMQTIAIQALHMVLDLTGMDIYPAI